MIEKVVMPHLGESVTEGTLSKWLVKVGDQVKKYDPLCEVETDKVVAEVPAMRAGTISEIVVKEGETVSVLSLICYIVADGESAAEPASAEPAEHLQEAAAVPAPAGAKQRFSPAVLKLAQEHNLDLSRIRGTGAGGRITRDDLMEIIEGKGQFSAAAVQEAAPAVQEAAPAVQEAASTVQETAPRPKEMAREISGQDQVIPLSAVRKTIATRMVQSKHDAPHAWTMLQCDVTNLVSYRSAVKDEFKKKEEINLTYMPFFIKAVVEALKEFPIINSQWDGDSIILKKAINISVAVASEDALFVPVIKDADQKSIMGLAKAVDQLVRKTKEGKLTMDDMSGGTFTVNNTGSFGSVLSAPIINQPQVAVLSVEAIVQQPVVINNMIAIRDMMNLCLSLDHRVLDGLVCGRFLQSVKRTIESYGEDTQLY